MRLTIVITNVSSNSPVPVGRFAPSPSGRMHLGNIFTALISWLSVRHAGGKWVLRIEDLDPQRSKMEFAKMIEDDLQWLGLVWDEGGTDEIGPNGPYSQSHRGEIYADAIRRVQATGYTYACTCSRADILATQAPHQSDGRVIYGGKCCPPHFPVRWDGVEPSYPHAVRLHVPDEEIVFNDTIYGVQRVNLVRECGDFILRRADGAWAYQLAVVVDDAMMGITEVVRGNDLLLSAAQQIYLYRLLGLTPPGFAHLPLVCNGAGRRLSKRDQSLSMEQLRARYSPGQLLGRLAYMANLVPEPSPCSLSELVSLFSWDCLPKVDKLIVDADNWK